MEIRYATRTVLLDEDERVAILYVGKTGYYKIPGGGIEKGEALEEAVRREVLEEAGCDCRLVARLGRIESDLPDWNMHDVSDGFLAYVVGDKRQPQFEGHEIERGFSLEWYDSVESALQKIENNYVSDSDAATLQARDLEFIRRAQAYLEQY